MEKTKQISLVRTLIAAVLLLIGSSGGVAWGQPYYIGTSVNDANNVNNEFGAGESATISGSTNRTGYIIYPGSSRLINNSPAQIWLGSTTGSGQNIVINSYNALGRFRDFVYNGTKKWSATTSGSCGGPCPSPPSYPDNTTLNYDEVIEKGCVIDPHRTSTVAESNSVQHCGSTVSASLVGMTLGCGETFHPYVRHTTDSDDGVDLVQLSGSANIEDDGTWTSNIGIPAKTTNGGGLTDYKRPTTVSISGKNTFTEFQIGDLNWWYKTFNVHTDARNSMLYNKAETYCDWSSRCSSTPVRYMCHMISYGA